MSLITVIYIYIYYYILSSGSNTLWDHTLYTKKKRDRDSAAVYSGGPLDRVSFNLKPI